MKFPKIISQFFSFIFPPHCVSCMKIVSKDGIFCEECWSQLKFITEPKCEICSYPFEMEITGMQPICFNCLQKKPSYDHSFIPFRYNEAISRAIADFKYRDNAFLIKKLASFLLRFGFEKQISNFDLMVAVPMHEHKLRQRKFNQSVLLCDELNKTLNKEFYRDLLVKVRNTKPQVRLTQKQRKKNLKRAFLVKEKYREIVKGKRVLLVDDVMTTGTTIESCAKELKRRGARTVGVLALARTVKD